MRAIPTRAVDFVSEFEGLRLESYQCPAGVWTIGYGHTSGVHAGMRITKATAKQWLGEDLKEAAAKIEALCGRLSEAELPEARWTALLSFVFNLGLNSEWQITKLLKARKFDAVPAQLARFVNAGGKRLEGLARRRAAEVALWNEAGAVSEELPSSFTRVEETPPTPEPTKPLTKSKTAWTAGAMAVVGGVQGGAQQVQALIAPQAQHSAWLGKMLGLCAMLIVAGGVAILVFKWLEKREAKR